MPVKDRVLRAAARFALTHLAPVLGRRRRSGVDDTLDAQIAAILEIQRMLRLPALESMEPPHARRFAATGLSSLDVDRMAMAEIVDIRVPRRGGRIPVRIFVPPSAGPHWIVYFHGGGGVIGSIASSEPVTRLLAAQTGCRVASVDYRLGPEERHPAAIDDACAAWDAICARVRPGGRIAVAGDSFGGFLSTHVDLYTIAEGRRRPDLQALFYPLVDLTLTSPSIDRFADRYLLTRDTMHWFRGNYLNPGDDHRNISPTYWPSLAGAAPALVATAGFDPLVDEGDEYVEQLRDVGTAVRHRRFPSLVHGFLGMAGGVQAARTATNLLCADIVELLAHGPAA